MAAQRHRVSVMELLIKHGADINDTNKVFAYSTRVVKSFWILSASQNATIYFLHANYYRIEYVLFICTCK